jgi:hypothetical protein
MRSLEPQIQKRLEHLQSQCVQHQLNLDNVRRLLAKADERRRQEPDRIDRWNQVLDNLETCLDESRARLERCKVDVKLEEQRLEALRAGESLREIEPTPPPEPLPPPPGVSIMTAQAAQRILNMPLDEIGKLSLEEVAMLQDNLVRENMAAAMPDNERFAARIEYANQTATDTDDLEDNRKQTTLRAAIEKISTNRIAEITEQEMRIVIACHDLLTRRLTTSPPRRTPQTHPRRRRKTAHSTKKGRITTKTETPKTHKKSL